MYSEVINTLIVEDHPHYLNGLSNYLTNKFKKIKIDQAQNGAQAITLVATNKYDVLILDMSLPDISGLEIASYVRKNKLRSKIITNSYDYENKTLDSLLKVDVDAIILKSDDEESIVNSILSCMENKRFFSCEIQKQLERNIELRNNFNLTKSEHNILNLIAKGLTNEHIAEETNISINTVITHRKNIYRKLNVHTTGEVIAIARKLGLLEE